MPAEFNHTIIYATDPAGSARFLADLLRRPEPQRFGPFYVVQLDNGVSLDFAAAGGAIRSQHYAFLIDDALFDGALERIRARVIDHWADPWQRRPGEINRNDGGRGVYFSDPDGHILEVITKPYGSGSS